MAANVGLIGRWARNVGVKLDIDDSIDMVDPYDVPLQQRLGSQATSQRKVEWLEEDLVPQTVNVSASAGTSADWTLTVDDAGVLRVDDVLVLDNFAAAAPTQQYVVIAPAPVEGGTTVHVAGFAGNTTAAVNTDKLTIIGRAANEGGPPPDARSVERRTAFNYTQIGQEKISVTRSERKEKKYGVGDLYDHEAMKTMRNLGIRFERALIHGQRFESGNLKQRFMGGILYYLNNAPAARKNTRSGVIANSKTLINQLLRDCYEKGGAPSQLWVGPAAKQAISDNTDPALRRTDRTDRVGGYVIDRVVSDFGEVEIYVDRWMPPKTAILLTPQYVTKRTHTGYFHEGLAKIEDSDHGQIVGEFSLELKNTQAHGVLTLTDVA